MLILGNQYNAMGNLLICIHSMVLENFLKVLLGILFIHVVVSCSHACSAGIQSFSHIRNSCYPRNFQYPRMYRIMATAVASFNLTLEIHVAI